MGDMRTISQQQQQQHASLPWWNDMADDVFRARLQYCDRLCARFDATHNGRLCERLRMECDLPCEMDQRFVDVVYLWANGSDPVYQQAHQRLSQSLVDKPGWKVCFKQATFVNRAREFGTFRFSVRALTAHFKHLRRIFVITPLGQHPTFLEVRHPRVRLLDTRQIVPIEDPSFNSNAIQFQMHRIPTLSDPFLTLNDDFLMLQDQTYETYIDAVDSRPLYRHDMYTTGMMGGCWGKMVKRTVQMFEELKPRHGTLFVASHSPLVIAKDVARFIARRWWDDMKQLSGHVFRNNVQDPTFDSFHIWVGTEMGFARAEMIPWECKGSFSIEDSTKADEVLTVLQGPPSCKSLALQDDFGEQTPTKLIDSINLLLETTYPTRPSVEVAATTTTTGEFQQLQRDPFLDYQCRFSGKRLRLHTSAFLIPQSLYPLHQTAKYRDTLRNLGPRTKAGVERRLAALKRLDVVDVANLFKSHNKKHVGELVVAQWHGARGGTWCEASSLFRAHATLKQTDFFFLSSQDLGMIRSSNAYTTRRLAVAMGLNYAWAPEFYEMSPSDKERALTVHKTSTWALHGNAILSPWKLEDASLVKFPDGHELFEQNAKQPGESRLGSRHALFAQARVGGGATRVTVAVMETMWHKSIDSLHAQQVVALLLDKIKEYGNDHVVIAGVFWPSLCEKLGLFGAVTGQVRALEVSKQGKVRQGSEALEVQICRSDSFGGGGSSDIIEGSYVDPGSKARIPLSRYPIVAYKLEIQ